MESRRVLRSRIRHELKTRPEFFAATRCGHKKFELRRQNRWEEVQVGDELLLKEWDPAIYDAFLSDFLDPPSDMDIFEATQAAYTGQELLVRVDYIMDADTVKLLLTGGKVWTIRPGCPSLNSFVIMSVSLVS